MSWMVWSSMDKASSFYIYVSELSKVKLSLQNSSITVSHSRAVGWPTHCCYYQEHEWTRKQGKNAPLVSGRQCRGKPLQPIISTCTCCVCGLKSELDLQDVQVTTFFCPQTGHLNLERGVAVNAARDDVTWSSLGVLFLNNVLFWGCFH